MSGYVNTSSIWLKDIQGRVEKKVKERLFAIAAAIIIFMLLLIFGTIAVFSSILYAIIEKMMRVPVKTSKNSQI